MKARILAAIVLGLAALAVMAPLAGSTPATLAQPVSDEPITMTHQLFLPLIVAPHNPRVVVCPAEQTCPLPHDEGELEIGVFKPEVTTTVTLVDQTANSAVWSIEPYETLITVDIRQPAGCQFTGRNALASGIAPYRIWQAGYPDLPLSWACP